jgi:hypothetical protein
MVLAKASDHPQRGRSTVVAARAGRLAGLLDLNLEHGQRKGTRSRISPLRGQPRDVMADAMAPADRRSCKRAFRATGPRF